MTKFHFRWLSSEKDAPGQTESFSSTALQHERAVDTLSGDRITPAYSELADSLADHETDLTSRIADEPSTGYDALLCLHCSNDRGARVIAG